MDLNVLVVDGKKGSRYLNDSLGQTINIVIITCEGKHSFLSICSALPVTAICYICHVCSLNVHWTHLILLDTLECLSNRAKTQAHGQFKTVLALHCGYSYNLQFICSMFTHYASIYSYHHVECCKQTRNLQRGVGGRRLETLGEDRPTCILLPAMSFL